MSIADPHFSAKHTTSYSSAAPAYYTRSTHICAMHSLASIYAHTNTQTLYLYLSLSLKHTRTHTHTHTHTCRCMSVHTDAPMLTQWGIDRYTVTKRVIHSPHTIWITWCIDMRTTLHINIFQWSEGLQYWTNQTCKMVHMYFHRSCGGPTLENTHH